MPLFYSNIFLRFLILSAFIFIISYYIVSTETSIFIIIIFLLTLSSLIMKEMRRF